MFAQHRMRGVRVADGFAKLAAKTSEDGQWLTANVIATAESLSFNFQRAMSCVHSDPGWSSLAPGESATAKGTVYPLRDRPAELWERYQRELEAWCVRSEPQH